MSKFWDPHWVYENWHAEPVLNDTTFDVFVDSEGLRFTSKRPSSFGYLDNELFIWKIKQIFLNPIKNVVVVIWVDGSKTRVKLADGEKFDLLNAVAAAVMKKKYGNNSAFKAHIKKNLGSYNDEAYSCIALYEACQLFHGYEEFKRIVDEKSYRSDLRKEIKKITER